MAMRVSIDAETEKIESRPNYPPRACGYSIKLGRRKSKYYAFGHKSGNNCTRSQAVSAVKSALREGRPCFHNADFDLEVLTRDGIVVKGEYDDTMRMAFLHDPRARNLGLKPQAAQHLDISADELDMLKGYIQGKVLPELGIKRKGAWADYIPYAPGDLTATYAQGDTDRTDWLADFYMEDIKSSGMLDAYRREMALIPIKLRMEQRGIRIRMAKLKKEIGAFYRVRERMEKAIRRRLGIKDMNVSSDPQLAKALVANNLLSTIVKTKTGRVSTKRALLEQHCTDKTLVMLLGVHGTLDAYIPTFLQRWLDTGEINDGYIQPTFNTVRQSDEWGGGGGFGARTGRFSSSDPNFQNIPSNVEGSPHERELRHLQKLLREEGVNFIGLRDYFAPDEGHVFLRRDYSQQELRILAHYDFDENLQEPGAFLKMYQANPHVDGHDAVQHLVHELLGVLYPRKHIKITNFGLLYGMGVLKLAARLGVDISDAKTLKQAVLRAVPGIKAQNKHMGRLASRGEPFYTWGGRRYYCEEPTFHETSDGGKERRTYEYKMLNTLIQGSAADCTKQAMINVDQNLVSGARIVLQVHDELVLSCPVSKMKKGMKQFREAMEDVRFRVPMLSDGEVGKVSWARMKEVTW